MTRRRRYVVDARLSTGWAPWLVRTLGPNRGLAMINKLLRATSRPT